VHEPTQERASVLVLQNGKFSRPQGGCRYSLSQSGGGHLCLIHIRTHLSRKDICFEPVFYARLGTFRALLYSSMASRRAHFTRNLERVSAELNVLVQSHVRQFSHCALSDPFFFLIVPASVRLRACQRPLSAMARFETNQSCCSSWMRFLECSW